MKTLTCEQMAGPCNAEIKGATSEEMMANGMAHIEEAHPEMAADIKAMPKDDPKMTSWYEKFMQTFTAAPEHE